MDVVSPNPKPSNDYIFHKFHLESWNWRFYKKPNHDFPVQKLYQRASQWLLQEEHGGYLARLVVPDRTIIMSNGNGVFPLILTWLLTDSACLSNSHQHLRPKLGPIQQLPLNATRKLEEDSRKWILQFAQLGFLCICPTIFQSKLLHEGHGITLLWPDGTTILPDGQDIFSAAIYLDFFEPQIRKIVEEIPAHRQSIAEYVEKICDRPSHNLTHQFEAAAIHCDKAQSARDYVLNQFRSGRTPILVATNVAARGLNIKDTRVVINFDFPTGVEDYVCRVERTGGAGAFGLVYTFFGYLDDKKAIDLIKDLEGVNQRILP
ncbi:hypothetical protein EV2_015230 [Malus domestica]